MSIQITDELLAELEQVASDSFHANLMVQLDSRKRAAEVLPGLVARIREAQRWIPVTERLPEPGVTVMVYTPPQQGDYPDDVRISFDGICPESDGDYWSDHGEHYDHYCAVAKGGDVVWIGPSEKAPYTHWQYLPEPPQ